jgi:tetratricopeptide (TPR) repeat protein
LRNNPNSYEILFELGRLYNENYHDTDRARNVWQLALRRWMQQDSALQKENQLGLDEITVNLAHLEEGAGNYEDAVRWFQAAQKASPTPDALQQQIEEIKKKMAVQTNAPAAAPRQP